MEIVGDVALRSPAGIGVILLWLAICLAIRWGAIAEMRARGTDPDRSRWTRTGPLLGPDTLARAGWIVAGLLIAVIFGRVWISCTRQLAGIAG